MTTVLDFSAASRLRASDTLYLAQNVVGLMGDDMNLPLGSLNLPFVYISQMAGVYGDADLSDPSVGHDDSVAIQAGMDAAPVGSVFVVDDAFKIGNVETPSNSTVLQLMPASWYGTGSAPTCGFIQAPGTQCTLRNTNWTSNYNGGSPVSDYSTIIDHDIKIKGVFFNGNRGNGGVHNACGGNSDIRYTGLADAYANPGTLPISTLMFFGVRNLIVEDMFVYDPGWLAFVGGYIDGFDGNITVVMPQTYDNQSSPSPSGSRAYASSIRFQGACRDIRLDCVSGWVDRILLDFVCDAYFEDYHKAPSAYYPVVYPGTQDNIVVDEIKANLVMSPLRLWSGEGPNNTGSASLQERVFVSKAHGVSFGEIFDIDGPSQFAGIHGTTVFDTWSFRFVQGPDPTGTGAIRWANIESTQYDLQIHNFSIDLTGVQKIANANLSLTPCLFWVSQGSGSRSAIFDGMVIYDPTSITYDVFRTDNQETYLDVSRFKWIRAQTAANSVLRPGSTATGTPKVTFNRIVLDGVAHLIDYHEGALNDVLVTGLQHMNANGNASILVDGTTLARLRGAGLDTALFLSTINGGTVTSSKTDGTEDS